MNSTVWNSFAFRDDDIVVATYAKSGTTWTQQIVGQLIFQRRPERAGRRDVALARPARHAARSHRAAARGADPPPLHQDPPAARRAGVLAAGQVPLHRPRRPRRDVEHVQPPRQRQRRCGTTRSTRRPAASGRRSAAADPDIRRYFRDWLEQDGYPFWPSGRTSASWWAIRDLPNVQAGAFQRSEGATSQGEMRAHRRRSWTFDIAEARWPTIVEHCTFD